MPNVFKKHHPGQFDDPSGLTVKLAKSQIFFRRNTVFTFRDAAMEATIFTENIATCRFGRNLEYHPFTTEPSIVHYLLCSTELPRLLESLNLEIDSMVFVDWENAGNINDSRQEFYFFGFGNTPNYHYSDFLRVNRKAMNENMLLRDIVAAIIKLALDNKLMKMSVVGDSRLLFTTLLGRILYTENHAINLVGHLNKMIHGHLTDETIDILAAHNVSVKNSYELLTFVLPSIDSIIESLTMKI